MADRGDNTTNYKIFTGADSEVIRSGLGSLIANSFTLDHYLEKN